MSGPQNSNRHGDLVNVAMPPDSQPEGMIVSDKTTVPAKESKPGDVTDVQGDVALRDCISNGLSRQRKWIIMFALCTAVFIVALDYFILTTALPMVTSEFGTSDAGFAWIGSAYLLTHAAFTPVWATISDVFGRKMVLNITNGFFFVGVLIGGLSRNTAILIVGRAIQGVGAAGIMVVAPICVGYLFNQRLVGDLARANTRMLIVVPQRACSLSRHPWSGYSLLFGRWTVYWWDSDRKTLLAMVFLDQSYVRPQ